MKKKVLIGILVVLIILFISVIIIVANNKLHDNNSKNNSTSPITDNRLKQLYDNSYKYFLLYQGQEDDLVQKDSITVEGVTYTSLSNFKSFQEVEKMINDTFTKARKENYYDMLVTNRKFIEYNNKLYVEYKDVCSPQEINFDSIELIEKDNNKVLLVNEKISNYVYYEDDNWYIDAPLHVCKVEENK